MREVASDSPLAPPSHSVFERMWTFRAELDGD